MQISVIYVLVEERILGSIDYKPAFISIFHHQATGDKTGGYQTKNAGK